MSKCFGPSPGQNDSGPLISEYITFSEYIINGFKLYNAGFWEHQAPRAADFR